MKPKQRLGQVGSRRNKIIGWFFTLLVLGGGGYGAYAKYYKAATKVEVPVQKVRKGEFIISVKTRGEVKSVRSEILAAPQVPDVRITKLATSGKPVRKGEVVVEFDAASQEQYLLERETSLRTVDSEFVQTKASHRITDEMDAMNLMTSQYNLQRSKLEASKAEVISEIDGAKNRIDVTISEGELGQVKTTIGAHDVGQKADIDRLDQKKDKAVRDMERTKSYLSKMVLRAPNDGIVNILPNIRSSGSFGSSPPEFKEGDRAWTGAAIAEIPDLSNMRVELKLDEVDRGKLKLGQMLRVSIDAIPELDFDAELDWISPIASVLYRGMGMSEKNFPARGTLKKLDPRLRPGMSATAEVIIESQPNSLLIPIRASFMHQGKPAVYVQNGQLYEIRPITVGKRNDSDLIVLSGLKEGDVVALENPADVAKRAKKL
ncbi:MAG: efflux RND transporter periplasmic adaptor subunit [Candidatus Solibacter usitatus]|nr:efflux RND transporter periplasmic adaptor subunit [Candidatus Solibacter usitatus]